MKKVKDYQIAILVINKFYSPSRHDENNEELKETWQQIQTIIDEAVTETVGKKKNCPKRKWFDKECEEVLEIKTKKRLTVLTNPTEENKDEFHIKRC